MLPTKQKLDSSNNQARPIKDRRRSSVLSSQLSNRAFFSLVVIEIIIISLVGYFFFIKGVSQQLASIKNDLLPARQTEYAQLSQAYADFLKIDSLYQSLDKNQLAKADLILPAKANLPDLIVNLDSLLQSNGLSLTLFSFEILNERGEKLSDKQKITQRQIEQGLSADLLPARADDWAKGELKIIKMELEIKGSGYAGLKNLILQLEKNLRLIDIMGLNFSPAEDKFLLELWTYYL